MANIRFLKHLYCYLINKYYIYNNKETNNRQFQSIIMPKIKR